MTDMIGNKNETAATGLEAVIEAAIIAASGLSEGAVANVGVIKRVEPTSTAVAKPAPSGDPKPS